MRFDARFITISAVLGGVKDIREAVAQAERARDGLEQQATIVFVDEVHRFNKSQQDAFLPHVESGLFTLHRRHDREPLIRGQLGLAVACGGVRAAATGGGRPGSDRRARPARATSSLTLKPPPPSDWFPMPMATRAAF
jgi:hypothetical protein